MVANNFLIIHLWFVDDESNESHMFDPRTQSWSQLAPLPILRFGYVLLLDKHHLYLVGGSGPYEQKEMIYTHDFETNTWFPFTKLSRPHDAPGACILGASMYVSGGFGEDSDRYSLPTGQHVECISLTTKKRESKAPLLEDMSGHMMGVMKLFGEDTLFVRGRNWHFAYYNMVSDQWSRFPVSAISKLPYEIHGYVTIHLGNSIFCLDRSGPFMDEVSMEITFTEDGQDIVIEHLDYLPDHGVRACYEFGVALSVPHSSRQK